MTPRIFALAFFLSAIAFAQLDTNTITVTTSRTLTVQPDQIVFGVTVSSGIGASLTDVLTALEPVGITAANFSGINSAALLEVSGVFSAGQTMLQWNFALPVPFAAMKTTVAAFTTLQQNITQNNTGLTLSFSVQGTQVSQQLQQMQTCPLAGLLSDAQTEAQQLANAAGLMAGAV